MSLSVVSLNARGLRNLTKRKAIFLYLKQFNCDFCFLQESHSSVEDLNFWRSQWGLDLWMSHGTTHSAGVCILKNKFKGTILLHKSDLSKKKKKKKKKKKRALVFREESAEKRKNVCCLILGPYSKM